MQLQVRGTRVIKVFRKKKHIKDRVKSGRSPAEHPGRTIGRTESNQTSR